MPFSNKPKIDHILDRLPNYVEELRGLREMILANTVLIGEIPSPTHGEQERIRQTMDRFREGFLQTVSEDESGNASAFIPGKTGERNILVVSHADTPFDANADHTFAMDAEEARGAGIADNSLGVGVLVTIPQILERLGIELESNVILLATTKSLGGGNLEGLRFFLENCKHPIHAAVCLEGAEIGRLSYNALGMWRAQITCNAEPVSWSDPAAPTAVSNVTHIVSKLLKIPVPFDPKTSVIIGSVQAGSTYKRPTKATVKLEVRSESGDMVQRISDRIKEIVEEVSAETETDNSIREVAQRQPGGIEFSHPLVRSTRHIMEKVGIKPKIEPSMSELSGLIDQGIPAVTLGLTQAKEIGEPEESIEIEPMFGGIAQIAGVLQAIDGGHCDDHR